MKTLIIFDIDGTLLYSNRADSICFARTYESLYRQPLPSINWDEYPHVTDTTIFHALYRESFDCAPEPGEIEHFTDHFVASLREERRLRPDEFREVPSARTTVERLRKDDRFVVGIATGGWERPARLKLDHVQVHTDDLYMSFADNRFTREDIINATITAAQDHHPGISRIVYVGDAPWDVRTTRNMQLPLVGVRWKGDRDLLTNSGVQEVITDYEDYQGFLEAVERAQPPSDQSKLKLGSKSKPDFQVP